MKKKKKKKIVMDAASSCWAEILKQRPLSPRPEIRGMSCEISQSFL
ncbi:MAG TPA: hypothetical protein PLZ42_04865 [Methanothrix sp.]|nr:hypothetical protein [Methanothrix sp.]